ncbi:MAG: hypothetical protein Q9218_006687 [Villophora microphyllina]
MSRLPHQEVKAGQTAILRRNCTRNMEQADLVVIGTGFNGLVMVKTYLDVNPKAKVIALESAHSVGGVWSEERMYPGLRTNNLYGTLEYSDYPMDEITFGVEAGKFMPGPAIHKYLRSYAEEFDIHRRIRFGAWVQTVERKSSEAWLIHYSQSHSRSVNGAGGATDNDVDQAQKQILTKKIVISTGLTSEPFIPHIPGSDTFNAPLFHAKYLLDNFGDSSSFSPAISKPVIYGSAKSAYDAAYAYSSHGISVDWIIRESGHGPVWMAPIYVTPLKKRLDHLVGVRFLTWFSPCVWGAYDGFGSLRRFFHNTTIGRWIVDRFWEILAGDVIALNGFDKHPETKKLKPWMPAFWIASGLSILNYPEDIYEYVRNGTIKVHVADIDHLSERQVHLSNGDILKADILVCSTGWKHRPSIKFLPEGTDRSLGLPHTTAEKKELDPLIQKADNYILENYPRLQNQPAKNKNYKTPTSSTVSDDNDPYNLDQPFRLYRFMVPPAYINDRSIGYTGMMLSLHTCICAQAQALWLTAYFGGALSPNALSAPDPNGINISKSSIRPASADSFDQETISWQTTLHSQFGRWRYPAGHGKRFPDMAFDAIPYVDMLLRDLGLQWRRKLKQGGWGRWWKEVFWPYGPGDYVGLVDEWRIARGM